MKNNWLFLLLLFFCNDLYTQNLAYNFPGDLDGTPLGFTRKNDGHFLLAGMTGGEDVRLFDKLSQFSKGYLLDWDANSGDWQLLDHLQINGDVVLNDVMELANGNLVVAGWDRDCGVNLSRIFIKCYDPSGNPLWTSYVDSTYSPAPNAETYPEIMRLEQKNGIENDTIVLFHQGDLSSGLLIVDANSGQLINQWEAYGFDMAINPVDGTIVVFYRKGVKRYDPVSGGVQQIIFSTLGSWQSFDHGMIDASGTIWEMAYGLVGKIPLTGSPNVTGYSYSPVLCIPHGNGSAVLCNESGVGHIVRFFDSNFQPIGVVDLPDLTGFNILEMKVTQFDITLVGFEARGAYTAGNYNNQASSHLLIRNFDANGNPPNEDSLDVSLSMTVLNPPVFTPDSLPVFDFVWKIDSGQYLLTLQNNSPVVVNSVNLLANKLGYLEFEDWCNNKKHFSMRLENLNLAPGEEMSFLIDTLKVYASGYPVKMCFWVSAPNDRLDFNRSNDYACEELWPTVSTGEPGSPDSRIGVFPNPATDQIRIVLPRAYAAPTRCRLYNTAGQLLLDREIPAGSVEWYENIGDAPPGIYLVEAAGNFGRFVKL